MDSHFINFIKIIMVKCAINTLPRPIASSFWLGGWVTTKVDRWTGGQPLYQLDQDYHGL